MNLIFSPKCFPFSGVAKTAPRVSHARLPDSRRATKSNRGRLLLRAAGAPAFSQFAEIADSRAVWNGAEVATRDDYKQGGGGGEGMGNAVPLTTTLDKVMRACGGAVSGILEKDVRNGELVEEYNLRRETDLELRRDNPGCIFWGDGSYTTGTHQFHGDEPMVLCLAQGNERLRASFTMSSFFQLALQPCYSVTLVLQRASTEPWEGASARLEPYFQRLPQIEGAESLIVKGDASAGEDYVNVEDDAYGVDDYVNAGQCSPGGPGGTLWDERFVRWGARPVVADMPAAIVNNKMVEIIAGDEASLLQYYDRKHEESEVRLIWQTAGVGIGRVYDDGGTLLRVVRYERRR